MKFKNKLNPKIWTGFNLKPEVKDKLKEIADTFIEYLDIPDEAIKDVRITGSSANYNYTPYSDIDLHLIVDYDKVHEDCPVVEGYLWSMKSQFNDEHDINIYDIPVELYAEDSRTQAVSNGVYSLTRDKWLKKPEKIPPTDNDNAVNAKFNELKDAIDKCDDSEEAQKLLDKIYQMRKSGLSEHGEFSTENLAFKKLRDSGKLQKLKELKKQKIDKQLSLEGKSKIFKTIRSIKECIKKANEAEEYTYADAEREGKIKKYPDGSIDCSELDLTSLEGAPREVEGDFSCYHNQLTSLEGAPKQVGGKFDCGGNQLTSLEGAPREVEGDFDCWSSSLTSLKGAPKEVGGYFDCSRNKLTSLEGGPQKVGTDFYCSHNQLTSLKGAPQKVGGDFYCWSSSLTSLEGAPQKVGGKFDCSNNELTSLEGAPKEVEGGFYCCNNKLTSLEGAPQKVSGDFCCWSSSLTSLEGAPKEVEGGFYCFNNQLTSLKGAPQKVGGNFRCENNDLKGTPEEIEAVLRKISNIKGRIYT